MNKFYLPHLTEIEIVDYGLYECPLVIKFNTKLNVIFGTNGTGKSTLLMLILFSIIGPYRGGIKTKTRNEQRKDNRPLYNEDFFKSRALRFEASSIVSARFNINRDEYYVTHSLNDGSLQEVYINGEKLTGKIVTYKTYEQKYSKVRENNGLGESELVDYLIYKYQEKIHESTELPGGFNTLISMLLDVMFFDESRKFTFWSADLQETVIGKYIVDRVFYEEYCEKKLDTKAFESKYKKASETVNFMAKFLEKEKEERKENSSFSEEDEGELRIKLVELDNDIQNNIDEINKQQLEYQKKNDFVLQLLREIEKIKERIQELDEIWYENLFPSQYGKYYKKFSPKMVENTCPFCGENHVFNIKTEDCIFCNTKLAIEEHKDLIKVDIERRNQQLLLASKNRELEETRKVMVSIKQRIACLKDDNQKKQLTRNQIEISLNPNKDLFEENDAKRLEKARSDRDEALAVYNKSKEEENEMKKRVESSLVTNFRGFSQMFCRYASSFFGNGHQIKLTLPFSTDEVLDETMIRFWLDGKERREYFMLSESQRIFTDLAFRFAVLTTFHEQSFFMCETPDSTLDLFHETNAVNTFKEYINMGNTLILTANARKSNLISELYNSYKEEEKNVIDLTELSKLALEERISFFDYVGGML